MGSFLDVTIQMKPILSVAVLLYDTIGGFHAISGDTDNNGEMNKCWWTNKAS